METTRRFCSVVLWAARKGPILEKRELPAGRQIEVAYAQPKKPKRSRDEPLPGKEKTGKPVQFARFGDRFFHRDLAGESREITVTQLDLQRLGRQLPVLKAGANIFCLVAQRRLQDLTIGRIVRKCLLAADALDLFPQLKGPIV